MENNPEPVVVHKNEWRAKDLKALTSQFRARGSLLRLKRRWLMDLPLSATELKRVDEMLPPNDKRLPESVLREDDVSYEDIKTFIETGFGAHNFGKDRHCAETNVRTSYSCDDIHHVSPLLDDMTNKGLFSLIKIFTDRMIKFNKTNCSMKRLIRELLPKLIDDKNNIPEANLKQLFQLLEEPANYRGNRMVCPIVSEDYHAAAVKVLNGIEDFPVRTLNAMHRKLRGVRGYIPSLQPLRSGRGRDKFSSVVKKMCLEMLSEVGEVGHLSERLAGALGVAGLTLKLIMNHSYVREFRKFSPEIEVLQNDIAKAIHLLSNTKRVSLIELKNVQSLLDPNLKMSVRSLRMAVRNLLTEYLYECGDMDKIPDFLVKTLNIINRRSQHPSRKRRSPQELMEEVIHKEVESVLTISAQAKEVVLNFVPEHEFDVEFAHAYMEDVEGSDDFCISDNDDGDEHISAYSEFHSYDSCGQTESIGETVPAERNSPVSSSVRNGCSPLLSPNERLNLPPEYLHITEVDSFETCGVPHTPFFEESKLLDSHIPESKECQFAHSEKLGSVCTDSFEVTTKQRLCSPSPARNSSQNDLKNEENTNCFTTTPKVEEANIGTEQSGSSNHYLQVQEACDATSMVAYRFVGHFLDKLAKIEGLELYQGDRLYLRNNCSVHEDSEESLHSLISKFPEMWRNVLKP